MTTTTLCNLQAEHEGTHGVRPAVALPASSAAAGLGLAPLRDPRHQGEPLDAAVPLLDGSGPASAGGRTTVDEWHAYASALSDMRAFLHRLSDEQLAAGNRSGSLACLDVSILLGQETGRALDASAALMKGARLS